MKLDGFDEWSPWTPIRFQHQQAREGFLDAMRARRRERLQIEFTLDPDGALRVRWRQGAFLALNDVAYRHGGRIAVVAPRRHFP